MIDLYSYTNSCPLTQTLEMTEKGVYSLTFTFYYIYLPLEMQRIELKVENCPKPGRMLQKQSNENT